MQYIIDVIFLALFVLIIIRAYKKGFFLTLFELVAYIASLIGAKLLSSALAPVLYHNVIYGGIRKTLEHNLGSIGEKDYAGQAAAAVDSIPSSFDGILKMIGVDRAELSQSIASSEYAGKNLVENLMDKVFDPIITAVVQTILFIVLVIVLTVVLRLIIRSLNKIIKKLPSLKQINSSLGALLGIIKGIFVVVILALLVGAVSGLFHNEQFIETVNKSFIITGSRQLLDSISGYAAENFR